MSACPPTSSHPSAASRGRQELAYRESDGVAVRLCWSPRDDEIYVHVRDDRTNEDFVLNPPKWAALFAYHHPYAAASQALKAGRIAA